MGGRANVYLELPKGPYNYTKRKCKFMFRINQSAYLIGGIIIQRLNCRVVCVCARVHYVTLHITFEIMTFNNS